MMTSTKNQKSVMIVDDDRGFIEALALYLDDHGYRPMKAVSGSQGLELLRIGGIDIAIIDLHLSDMDGCRLVREAIDRADPIPTVVITSDDAPGVKERCGTAGACSFLLKPIAPVELLQVISNHLDKRS